MSRRHAALTALFVLIACDTPAAPRARELPALLDEHCGHLAAARPESGSVNGA